MADGFDAQQAGGGAIKKVSTEEITTLNGAAVPAQDVQRVIIAARTADNTAVDVDVAGSSVSRLASSAASNNATNVKTSAGAVDGVKAKNNAAYAILVTIYNDNNADSDPVDDNLLEVLEFPAGSISSYDFPSGITCSTGIGFKLTKASDGSAVAAGDITNFSLYYR